MRKFSTTSLSFAWVKNVYSLRTVRGIKSGLLYTDSLLTQQFTNPTVHNSPLIRLFVLAFAPLLSTTKISVFNLLFRRLYPQSTPPINMKKKKI